MAERNGYRAMIGGPDLALTATHNSPATLALGSRDGQRRPQSSHADHESLDEDGDHVANRGLEALPMFCSYPR
jgi:hypothetical protein